MSDENAPEFLYILYEVRNRVGYITLNQPQKLNAFHLPMYHEIRRAFDMSAADDAVRVVVIKGAGRAFCAGRDFKYSADLQLEGGLSAWRREYKLFGGVTWFHPKLVIAQVHGYALGGGGSLALLCDLTFAATGTKFGYPETRHGIASKTMVWPWTLGVKVANEVVASGRLVSADDCKHLHLVNEVFPPDELGERVDAIAQSIASSPVGVPELVKRMVNWVMRDQGRVTQQDRQYDVDTAHWDAAGVVPSDWMQSAIAARRTALLDSLKNH
ncbi:enoyl-CoA hydratase/isomerase family protein [Paraburkholderia xenovorans LB400]|nr:enoyl-CoA hydratase/isomerase family protein [Paraburkholderia xenovorans]AIP34400.1 enoyl-CoA hydratase/isomerase family protein [Paraburkholderia xenovorans LB400]